MRKFLLFFLFAVIMLPLHAETVLQQQADKAQNFLERTLSRMKHAWVHMQYHFSEGNIKLKETAQNIPVTPPQNAASPIRKSSSQETPQLSPQINIQVTPQISLQPAAPSAPAVKTPPPAKPAARLDDYELPPIPEVPDL